MVVVPVSAVVSLVIVVVVVVVVFDVVVLVLFVVIAVLVVVVVDVVADVVVLIIVNVVWDGTVVFCDITLSIVFPLFECMINGVIRKARFVQTLCKLCANFSGVGCHFVNFKISENLQTWETREFYLLNEVLICLVH